MPGLKAITANTDPAAKAHVYAEDDAAIFQSIVGADGVFDIGQKCAATILSNNQVRVEDGVVCIGGHFARIPYGDYADCSIANGQSGYNRNDIIVAKIVSTGFGGIDTMTCEVKQGEAGVTASDPTITKGNMYAGELEREFPLYRVRIEGLSIAGVDQLFDVIPTIPQTEERIVALEKKADELNSKYAIVEKKYSLSLSENEYVQPYVRFGTLDISEDVVKYGYPISMTASDTRGVPVPLYISHNGYGVYTLKICGWVEGNEAIVYFRKGLD